MAPGWPVKKRPLLRKSARKEAEAPRLLFDAALSPESAAFARHHGFDAVHVQDVNMLRSSDEEILEHARMDRRVLVTLDLDFARILALTGEANRPSVAILRLRLATLARVHDALLRLARLMPGTFRNAIILVEQDRIRVRYLPLPATGRSAAAA